MMVSMVYETDDYEIQAIADKFDAMGVKIVIQGSHFTTRDGNESVSVGTSPTLFTVQNGDIKTGIPLEASGETFLTGIFNLNKELVEKYQQPNTGFAVETAPDSGQYDIYGVTKSSVRKTGMIESVERPKVSSSVVVTTIPRFSLT